MEKWPRTVAIDYARSKWLYRVAYLLKYPNLVLVVAPLDFSAIYEAFTTYLILTLEFLHEIRSEFLRHQGYTI